MNQDHTVAPSFRTALRTHWPEALMEAAGLGLFMLSAAAFGTLLEHPESLVRRAVESDLARRAFMGTAMAATSIALVYSPWGRRSGAHFNPSVTLAFLRLGKVAPADAILYAVAQVLGGLAGIALAAALLGPAVGVPEVRYVATVPGAPAGVAFLAELAIAFVLMTTVLFVSNARALARFTGVFAGTLVALYITFESPVSGMSLNPARSFASAVPSSAWTAFWILVTAPPLGMLLATEAFRSWRGGREALCAKLHHDAVSRCIFRCGYHRAAAPPGSHP
jgi:aquaporin Z